MLLSLPYLKDFLKASMVVMESQYEWKEALKDLLLTHYLHGTIEVKSIT